MLYAMFSSPFVPCTPYMNLFPLNLGMLAGFVVWPYLYFTLSVLWFLPHRSVKVDKTIIPVPKRDLTWPFSSASFFFSYYFLLPDYFCINSAYLVSLTNFSFLNSKPRAKARSKSAAPHPRRKNTAHYESSSLSW